MKLAKTTVVARLMTIAKKIEDNRRITWLGTLADLAELFQIFYYYTSDMRIITKFCKMFQDVHGNPINPRSLSQTMSAMRADDPDYQPSFEAKHIIKTKLGRTLKVSKTDRKPKRAVRKNR
jgi:hypothetical protein